MWNELLSTENICAMKKLFNLVFAGIILSTGCTSSEQRNESVSDTGSVLNNTQNSSSDSSGGVGDTRQSDSALVQESNATQSPRVSVGADTTGKQEHDK